MQQVIASIIIDAQAGFIPGRKVADNIILAHGQKVKAYTRKHISARCMIKVDIQKAYDTVDWRFLHQVMEGLGFPQKFLKWVHEYDLLLYVRGDATSVALLHEKFSIFSAASGLQANLNKSAVYYGGVTNTVKQEIQTIMGYTEGTLPFTYLRVPLSIRKLKILEWQPLINRIVSKVSSWTAKKLSYAGRVQLVKSVLFGIQSYWAQMFILPAKVMKTIEAYCRSYIWSGTNEITRKALVSWSRLCLPKTVGGLNITNLKNWNKAVVTKTCWDLAIKKDTLWIKWIHSHYVKNQNFAIMPLPQHASWMVKKILKSRDQLVSCKIILKARRVH
ncbi:uncharacterized protein LOC132031620 [Lycium ferocissimum]|uniref:uncharacterized protein LOC132031620 n=1 Tax=Lycium ferocissimum TaxID=112874 RepID=UPI002815F5C8|nr:uncharacterized protein LOC132031620 [Lycium ferocissimum]